MHTTRFRDLAFPPELVTITCVPFDVYRDPTITPGSIGEVTGISCDVIRDVASDIII